MFKYYTALLFLNIFSMLILQICVGSSNTLTTQRKKLFRCLFAAIAVAAFCEWMGVLLQGKSPSLRLLHITVKIIELSVAPSVAFIFAWIIELKWQKQIAVYLGANFVLECLSGIFGFIYRVDENNIYSHEKFYWIYIAVYVLSIAYTVFIVLRNIKKYQYNGMNFVLLIAALMLTGIIIQLCRSELKVDYITLGIASIMLYVFTLEMVQQTDELTGLLNRRGYENYILNIDKPCIVAFFDVDKFKKINDTYGHASGDAALKSVGTVMRKVYAGHGKCFRYGGDEFCVILTENPKNIEALNRNFLHIIAEKRESNDKAPSVSIGYAYYDPKTQNIQEAIDHADAMMYEFKTSHRKQ